MIFSAAALAKQEITNFAELRRCAQPLGPKRVAIVGADDEVALTAADGALHLGIAIPVLIGDERKIRAKAEALGLFDLIAGAEFVGADDAAAAAIHMAHDGRVDLLLKGHLRTDELLRAALDKQAGLRTGRLLSDRLLYEDKLAGSAMPTSSARLPSTARFWSLRRRPRASSIPWRVTPTAWWFRTSRRAI